MRGQQGGWMWASNWDDLQTNDTTIQVDNRNVFVEVAVVKTVVAGEDWWYSEVGISQVVSDSGVEDFDPPRYVIYRRGVTSITFHLAVVACGMLGRWLINFWS